VIGLWLWACASGGATDSTPPVDDSATDTSTPPPTLSHAVDIQPIWTANCTDEGCHILEEGRVMSLEEGYAFDSLVDRASSQFPLYDLVEPGHPAGSYLTHKLGGTHTDVGGMGRQMPTGKDPLPDADQLLIQDWIDQGAPP